MLHPGLGRKVEAKVCGVESSCCFLNLYGGKRLTQGVLSS